MNRVRAHALRNQTFEWRQEEVEREDISSLTHEHQNTEGRRHARCVFGVPRLGAVRHGIAAGNDCVRAAHVEGDGVHRLQHRGSADHLGRSVDVLCGAEHGPNAVQSARFGAGTGAGSTDGPSSHGHLCRAGGRRPHGDHRRGAMYQLHQGRDCEGASGERRRGDLHHQRAVHAGSTVLDGQQHHRELPRPAGASVKEEGDRGCDLHRLGCHSAAAARRDPALLFLLPGGERRVSHQVRTHQDDRSQRGV